jgi:hypothetical protein
LLYPTVFRLSGTFLPIQSSKVESFRTIVTLRASASQTIVPPTASTAESSMVSILT